MFDTLFGAETPLAVRFSVAFLIMLGLFSVVAWAVHRHVTGRLGAAGLRPRQLRLEVADSASIDGRRRLILIRRDNVEHLMMIGGPIDLVIESNIMRAVVAPHEVVGSPDATELMPQLISHKRSRPLQLEPVERPRPTPRIEPLPVEPTSQSLRSLAETSTHTQRDTLAGLADELSTYWVPPPSRQPVSARARPAGSGTPTVSPPPPSGKSASANPSLADLARHFEAVVHRPAAPADERDARPGLHAVEQRAPSLETAPPPRSAPTVEPKPTHAAANADREAARYDGDDLARGLANLLGRPTSEG